MIIISGIMFSSGRRSFVSVVHLAVGVVYCLLSWGVGLPKRAVSVLYIFLTMH